MEKVQVFVSLDDKERLSTVNETFNEGFSEIADLQKSFKDEGGVWEHEDVDLDPATSFNQDAFIETKVTDQNKNEDTRVDVDDFVHGLK